MARTARSPAPEPEAAPAAAAPETAAPETGSTITTITLDKLMLSRLNVRKTERDADIDALAEDIAARGLKQNLVVIPAHFMTGGTDKDWTKKATTKDKFEVIAGGRRFQAMQLLAADGRLPADHPVPCMIEDREAARETSLSENLHRVAMNPADEFEAFAAIVHHARETLHEPDPQAYCAKRFGVTRRLVEQRLRLASLAPEILEALRARTITLDTAKAYGATADHARQVEVFTARAVKDWMVNDARGIRQEMLRASVAFDDPMVLLLGIDAYRAAGGRTETDLFMGAATDAERLIDVPLLRDLVSARAAVLAEEQAKADGYARGEFVWAWGQAVTPEGFRRVFAHPGIDDDLPESERAQIVAVYVLSADGTLRLELTFHPAKLQAEAPPKPDWRAEYLAEQREREIEIKAAQIAAQFEVTSTVAEGSGPALIWPTEGYCDALEEADDDEHILVACQLRVRKDAVPANIELAARLVDEALAREAAEAAAAAAEEPDENAHLDEEEEDA